MFCCDLWFGVVWLGLIGRVFVFVCLIVKWLCGLSYAMLYGLVAVVLVQCCCVCDVC